MMQNWAEKEVVELHQFFEDWFVGVLADDEQSFGRVADVLAEGFVIVNPAGAVAERTLLLEGLRQAHGRQADFRIWIENFRWLGQVGEMGWGMYEEWQEKAGVVSGRVSTVLFRQKPDTPNDLQWQHVHETWIGT